MARKIDRRGLLTTAASLVALAGCSRLQPVPSPSAPTSSPAGTPTPTPSPTPSAAFPVAPNLPAGHVNVLIIGSDSRSGDLNDNARSDVICLAQLTAGRSRINLVSVARDTVADVPGRGPAKVNDAYAIGGAPLLAQVVQGLLGGVPIHFTLETGFFWFAELSRLLGGFTVDNRIASDSSGVAFPAGPLNLIGEDALTYARERYGLPNGDLDRTERHRACLTGIVDRLAELARSDGTGGALASLTSELWARVRPGGLVLDDALSLVPAVRELSRASVASAMLPVARFDMVAGMSVDIIDADRAAELVAQLQAGDIAPYQAAYGLDTTPTGGRG